MSAICDFCSHPDVRFAYPARDLTAPVTVANVTLRLNSHGGWAACGSCHDLIERGDRDGLANRSVDRFGASRVMPRSAVYAAIRKIHDDFWSQREGAPVHASPEEGDPTRDQ